MSGRVAQYYHVILTNFFLLSPSSYVFLDFLSLALLEAEAADAFPGFGSILNP